MAKTTKKRVRIIPLGGMGEVGKNMTVYEYGNDIILVDVGVGFPEEEMFGVDLVIPDITYLADKLHRIRGIFITHGHEDHIGSLPYLLTELGNPPIYGTPLTLGLISVKLRERRLLEKAVLIPMGPEDVIEAGAFTIEPFRVCHSIPDAVGFGITTPAGLIVHTGDYKFDLTPVDGRPTDFGKIAALGNRGVLALVTDCVHVETPGFTASERVVEEAFDRIFAQTDGRIIVATFASLISRIQQVVDVAQRYGRKVCPIGRSMENNVEMALGMDYLHDPHRVLVDVKRAAELPPNRVAYVVTGSQGEPMAALSRMAGGDHRQLKILSGDTVIISATPIPGNETSVGRIINNLFQLGADVIYSALTTVHVSGHASREELKLMLNLTRPKYVLPLHGEQRHLILYKRLAESMGWDEEAIVLAKNGSVVGFSDEFAGIVETVHSGFMLVDGVGAGEVGEVVIRDRQMLARDGILMVVVSVDKETGKLISGPDIVSRGFVSQRRTTDLIEGTKERLRDSLISTNGHHPQEWSYLTRKIKDVAGSYLYEQTRRRPMIMPMVMEV
ncbi:MAG: ribonuclease J [Thermomicrobia bacterium]|nr:ribonuclease J [Thermomicrobia bacterium]MCA1722811.1 ribonuclease J [Thermomicrobia bacterium]